MELKIRRLVASNLFLRESANSFFDTLESKRSGKIVVDFAGVETMSRSFAHQYLLRKRQSSKQIQEISVPKNVKEMFKIVETSNRKPELIVERPFEVHNLTPRPAL